MPKEFPDSNNAIDDKSTSKTDGKEDLENCQHSPIQKMRDIVQNFFNHLPTKWLSNELKDGRNKHAGQTETIMSRNARNSPHKNVSRSKEDKKSLKNQIINCRHRYCTTNQHLDNEQLMQNANQPVVKRQFDASLTEKLKSTENCKINKEINKDEVEAILVDYKETESIPNKGKESSSSNERKSESLKQKSSESQENLKIPHEEIQRRHSEPPVRRLFSSDDTNLEQSRENISSKCQRLPEKRGSAQTSHMRSRSVVLLNESDVNFKLSKFKPDVSITVHQVSEVESNLALMSGGQVVFERFADVFKIPNYYTDDPIVFNVTSNDADINQQSSLERSYSETFVSEKYFSGGKMTCNYSKGMSLPELFPKKLDILNSSPVQRHLSCGETVKPHSSESKTSLDYVPDGLVAQEITANSGFVDVFDLWPSVANFASKTTCITQDVEKEMNSDFSRLQEKHDRVHSNELQGMLESAVPCIYDCPSDSSDKCSHESTAYGL